MNNASHVVYIPEKDGESPSVPGDQTLAVFLIFSSLAGFLGNIPALVYFWGERNKSLHFALYSLISAADICTSLSSMPIIACLFNDRLPTLFTSYTFTAIWTIAFNFLQRFSMFMVLMISATRSIAVLAPFYKINRPAALIACPVFAVIILTIDMAYLATGELVFVYWSPGGGGGVAPPGLGTPWTIYVSLLLTTIFGISLAVFVSFVLSTLTLLKKEKENSTRNAKSGKKFRGVTITIALFTAVFLLNNLPLFTIQLVQSCIEWFKWTDFLQNDWFIFWYGFMTSQFVFTVLNAALNPCLYLVRMKKFRGWVMGRLEDRRRATDSRSSATTFNNSYKGTFTNPNAGTKDTEQTGNSITAPGNTE